MKAVRTQASDREVFDDIVEALKRVPKTRLSLVRARVHTLAIPPVFGGKQKTRARKRRSLLGTLLCVMWVDRDDITDERTYARQLRRTLETR